MYFVIPFFRLLFIYFIIDYARSVCLVLFRLSAWVILLFMYWCRCFFSVCIAFVRSLFSCLFICVVSSSVLSFVIDVCRWFVVYLVRVFALSFIRQLFVSWFISFLRQLFIYLSLWLCLLLLLLLFVCYVLVLFIYFAISSVLYLFSSLVVYVVIYFVTSFVSSLCISLFRSCLYFLMSYFYM